jgi:hypothetical protein
MSFRHDAEEQYRRALMLDKNHFPALYNLALMLKPDPARQDEAIELITRAASMSTDRSADAHYGVGLLLHRACPHEPGFDCCCTDAGGCLLLKAATALEAAVIVDPSHHRSLLRLRLVRGEAAGMDSLPAEWVQHEYDSAFAGQFERKLLGGLAYTSHSELAASVAAATVPRNCVCFDVGCGTGLCGRLLRAGAGWLVGVDLAPAMAAAADEVVVADASAALRAVRPGSVGAVVAADVAVYIGDLMPLVEAAAQALTEQGAARADGGRGCRACFWRLRAASAGWALAGRSNRAVPALRRLHGLVGWRR